jgi:thioredoxin 1
MKGVLNMAVLDLTDASFRSEVLETALPVLVDFTAEWCGPCKQVAPIVDQLSVELAAQLKVGRLDIDQNVGTTMQFGVLGLPTLILFKNGQPVERWTGFVPKPKLLQKLKTHLTSAP